MYSFFKKNNLITKMESFDLDLVDQCFQENESNQMFTFNPEANWNCETEESTKDSVSFSNCFEEEETYDTKFLLVSPITIEEKQLTDTVKNNKV